MKQQSKKMLCFASLSFILFIIWTVLVKTIDVQPICPNGTYVGFATINKTFHNLTGVNLELYTITDILSIIPFIFMFVFALIGLLQWIKRKSLFKVDSNLFLLGAFYIIVAFLFILFEIIVINYRPILIDGKAEPSYPSSTTMLVMCFIPTAIIQLKRLIKNKAIRLSVNTILIIYTIFMVVCRMMSGVHWLSDIIAGALLSTSLILFYVCTTKYTQKQHPQK